VQSLRNHAEDVYDYFGPRTSEQRTQMLARQRYWICSFSNNQWCISEELGAHWTESSFYLALRGDSCKGTVMILDDDLQPLRRSWCMFEVWQTFLLQSDRPDDFTGLTLATAAALLSDGNAPVDTVMKLAEALADIRIEDAYASSQADKDMINSAVANQGGFDDINQFLRNKMYEQVLAAKQQLDESMKNLAERLVDNSDIRIWHEVNEEGNYVI